MTTYPITPIAKPRMTRSDKWKKRPCVMNYRAFADEVRLRGVTVGNGAKVVFHLPMPKSWSKKKQAQMHGMPHTQKPDIDNLTKALLDALYQDDSFIWQLTIEKRWSVNGSITIS